MYFSRNSISYFISTIFKQKFRNNWKKILYKFDKNEFLLNFNINISSNFISEEFPSIAKYIEVSLLENKDAFTALEWKSLYELSEQTFVEETESLKQSGAGAGLTDND